jgi:hypothetical protein
MRGSFFLFGLLFHAGAGTRGIGHADQPPK